MINFCSVCNEDFIPGLLTLIYSIKKHNTFDLCFYIIDDNLSEMSKADLKNIHNNIVFVDIDYDRYEEGLKKIKTGKHILSSFYIFEAFRLNLDNMLIIDCDMLCLKNFEDVYNKITHYDFCVTNLNFNANFELSFPYQKRKEFSSGFIFSSKKYINKNTYNALLKLIGECESHPFGDQPVFNHYFKDKEICFVTNKINGYKRFFSDSNLEKNKKILLDFDPIFLHYAGPKPWNDNGKKEITKKGDTYTFINNLWEKEYKNSLKFIDKGKYEHFNTTTN